MNVTHKSFEIKDCIRNIGVLWRDIFEKLLVG